MAHYIDKAALVAEINKRIMDAPIDCYGHQRVWAYNDVKDIINTLEVKEVGLEHEVESYWKQCDMTWCRDAYSMTHIRSMLSDIAKHFYELGLKAQKGEKNITRKEVENLKERFKPIHDCGRRMFGSEAYDSHIKEVLKLFGYDTEDDVIKEIFDI